MSADLVVTTAKNRVTTIRMNNPKKLNGWTAPMMEALKPALRQASDDPDTDAIVLTGTDPYYSAGVNLGGTLQLGHPRTLHAMIVEHNQALFDAFLDVDTPILAAVNGPAIGAPVTSATLCDGLLASEQATFLTPFARLGVPAEGCSSVLFEKLMGTDTAQRMLGEEGWKPTGAEAAEVGLATEVVPHDQLLDRAQAIAEQWIADGRQRTFRGGMTRAELKAVNARESVQVADAFLDKPFLEGQYRFLRSKGKRGPAAMFWLLRRTHRLWSKLL